MYTSHIQSYICTLSDIHLYILIYVVVIVVDMIVCKDKHNISVPHPIYNNTLIYLALTTTNTNTLLSDNWSDSCRSHHFSHFHILTLTYTIIPSYTYHITTYITA